MYYELLFLITFFIGLLGIFYLLPKEWVYFFILLLTPITPILIKVGVFEGVYVHIGFVVYVAFIIYWLARYGVRSHIKMFTARIEKNNTAIVILAMIGLLLYGVTLAFVRENPVDVHEALRVFLYSVGFATFFISFLVVQEVLRSHTVKANTIFQYLVDIFVIAVILFTVIGIFPVLSHLMATGDIDNWAYGPEHRMLGILGRYISADGIQLIASAAAGNAGLILNLAFVIVSVWFIAALKKQNHRAAIVTGLILFLFGIGVVFTLSRATYLTFALALILIGWIYIKAIEWRIVYYLMLLIIPLSVLVVFPTLSPVEKIIRTIQIQDGDIVIEPSARGRVERWGRSVQVLLSTPQTLIVGEGNIDLSEEYGLNPHSMVFLLAIRYGLLGIALFILFWSVLISDTMTLFRDLRGTILEPLALALFVVSPGWFIDNLISGENIFSIELLIVYFGFLGIAFGYRHMLQNKV